VDGDQRTALSLAAKCRQPASVLALLSLATALSITAAGATGASGAAVLAAFIDAVDVDGRSALSHGNKSMQIDE
jgi:hypothetical protein